MLRQVFLCAMLIPAVAILSTTGSKGSEEDLYPRPPDSCLACHADIKRMKDMGFPEFYTGGDTVSSQETAMIYSGSNLRMPYCVSCHLGNPNDYTVEGAHKGIVGPLFMMNKERVVKKRSELTRGEREQMKSLTPTGRWDIAFQPKYWDETAGKWNSDPAIASILWHDHNQETAAFNPVIAMKTCGPCHLNETSSFSRSPMGGGEFKKGERESVTQAQYTYWLADTGPHSCGIWVGKLAEPDLSAFTQENLRLSNKVMSKEISPKMMEGTQRNCNHCHVVAWTATIRRAKTRLRGRQVSSRARSRTRFTATLRRPREACTAWCGDPPCRAAWGGARAMPVIPVPLNVVGEMDSCAVAWPCRLGTRMAKTNIRMSITRAGCIALIAIVRILPKRATPLL